MPWCARMGRESRQFALEIDKELDICFDQWNTVIRKISLQALTGVVLKTPVDTGRARGNWFAQIGGAGNRVTDDTDPSGNTTIATGSNEIAKYKSQKGFPVISLYNNLPYINRLENGYSNQAPNGMVSLTVVELQVQLR